MKINDIIIKNSNTYSSEVFAVSSLESSNSVGIYINRGDCSVVSGPAELTSGVYNFINNNNYFYIKLTPRPNSENGQLTVVFYDEKNNILNRVECNVFIESIAQTPVLTGSSNGNIYGSIDQNVSISETVSFSCPGMSLTPGAANVKVLPKHTNNAQDMYIASQAISAYVSTDGVTVSLANPNNNGSAYDSFGFSQEIDYIISFDKDVTVDGKTYNIKFFFDVTFKSTEVLFAPLSIQTAVVEQHNPNVLVNYFFDMNVIADEKQFYFGQAGLYNVPTKISTFIPRALYVAGTTSSLDFEVTAQSISRHDNHYCLTMNVKMNLPSNRSIAITSYKFPLKLKVRGIIHNFELPVRIVK